VLSYGYGVLRTGLSNGGGLTAGVLLAVALGKIATTSLTIGSGGSGGVFGVVNSTTVFDHKVVDALSGGAGLD
jgi:hypothetical protein